MNSSRKYEYVMDEPEIRECGLFLLGEYVKSNKRTWLLFLLIVAAEWILIPKYAVVLAPLAVALILILCVYYYMATAKILRGQPSAVWIEGDRLKAQRRDYSEIPCTDMQTVRRKKRLLMLGFAQGDKRQVWFVVPLRVFADGQEEERFLAMLHNPQNQRQGQNVSQGQKQWQGQNGSQENIDLESQYNAGADSADSSVREYLNLSCRMDEERWVRLNKGAADLVNGGSLGKPARFRGMILWLCIVPVVLLAVTGLTARKMDLPIVCFDIALAVWTSFWLFYRNPEKRIRKQIKTPQALRFLCGLWQFSLTQEGICIRMPADRKNVYMWKSLAWMLETEDAFYFFSEDKKRFFAIPKEGFVSREQVELFHRICAERGIKKMAPKKARYVPGWLLVVIFGLIVLAFFASILVKAFWDTGSASGNASGQAYARAVSEKQVDAAGTCGTKAG